MARTAPDVSAVSNKFVFEKGRLWAVAENGRRALALVDTGASMSVFPDEWHSTLPNAGSEIVSTPFGQRQLPVSRIESLQVGGILFDSKVLIAKVRYPVIGNDILFSRNNVLLSQSGAAFDVEYDPNKAIFCARAVVRYQGNTLQSPVDAIFLMLNIDGVEQKVFLDTGIAPALQATAFAPMPKKKLFPRPDIRSNSLGEWRFVPYFGREASLSLGNRETALSYHHYYTDRSVDAPFVMGAGILNDYSILIDHRKGRACFFRAGA